MLSNPKRAKEFVKGIELTYANLSEKVYANFGLANTINTVG